jgi:integrase
MALTDTFVKQTREPGKHADGGGMYLHVTGAGKYWRMDYRYAGKRKTLALGVYPAVKLKQARDKRDEARELLAQDKDPSVAKRQAKIALAVAAANTFEAVARDWLDKTAANRKPSTQERAQRWIERDIAPYIGKLPIASIGPRDLLEQVLRKVEGRGTLETAHRINQLCGQIWRFAVQSGLAERDITADLRGALTARIEKHYAAITEPKQAGELMRAIHAYRGHPTTEAALKLSPLVFVRPGELRAAEWAEINFEAAEWRIPGEKMKMGIDHIVPLSRQAVEILRTLHPFTGHGRYVFPSIRSGGQTMSNNTLNAALRGMGYSQEVHTAHGFRAMARTIMDEVLGERVDFIEHQLAHAVKDVNGRAYNRTAHLPARREMMQRWADYLDRLRVGAQVIPMPRVA